MTGATTELSTSDREPKPPASPTRLTWALGIATYNRREVLMQCLELAAKQTRPPKQIVVVDASPDWRVTRDRVAAELKPRFGGIEWVFEPARRPSAAVQRNQCLELADADVVMLFDDDSLMYPDCAEHLMRVYEADARGEVAGVAAHLVDRPPELSGPGKSAAEIEAERAAPSVRSYNAVERWVRRLLAADDIFIPYDEDFPRKPLPEHMRDMGLGRRPLMAGLTMTVRREPALRERFEELLADRGPEDSDLSYRLSRHGALATCFEARVFHVGSPAGRFSRFSREALGNLGPLVLHRLYSTDLARSRRRSRAMLLRRSIIGLLKDVRARQWNLATARGAFYAFRRVGRVLSMDEDELRRWYPEFQRELLGR